MLTTRTDVLSANRITTKAQGGGTSTLIYLVIGILVVGIIGYLWVSTSEDANKFLKQCNLGTCVLDEPRCVPSESVRQAGCEAKQGDETLEGICITTLGDVPDDCVVENILTDKDAEEQDDESNQDDTSNEDSVEETSPDATYLEIRQGSSSRPLQNGGTIQLLEGTETDITMWGRGSLSDTCKIRILDAQKNPAPSLTPGPEAIYDSGCSNGENSEELEQAGETLTVTLTPKEEHVGSIHEAEFIVYDSQGTAVQSSYMVISVQAESNE